MLDKNLVRLLKNLYDQNTDGADYEFAIDLFSEIEKISKGKMEDIIFGSGVAVASDYEDIFDDTMEAW